MVLSLPIWRLASIWRHSLLIISRRLLCLAKNHMVHRWIGIQMIILLGISAVQRSHICVQSWNGLSDMLNSLSLQTLKFLELSGMPTKESVHLQGPNLILDCRTRKHDQGSRLDKIRYAFASWAVIITITTWGVLNKTLAQSG